MHIIQRTTVSFNVITTNDMKLIQEELSNFCTGPLMDRLEKILDKISLTKELKIDLLELEFELDKPEDFEQTLLALIEQKLVTEITKNLPEVLPIGMVNENSQDQFQPIEPAELLIHFLQFGSLPWWSKSKSLETLLSRVIQESTGTQKAEIFRFLLSNEIALTRLIYQWKAVNSLTFILELFAFSHLAAKEISSKINPKKEVLLTALSQSFKSISPISNYYPYKVFESIIFSFTEKNILTSTEAMQLISSFVNASKEDKSLPTKFEESNSINSSSDGEEWYIENAGLILLNPFISGFLQEYGACDSKQMIDPNLALYLLQYLATGNEQVWESDLVLNKILCGLPLDFVVKPPIILPENLKAESEKLITTALKYWPVMQGTSIEGFREAFLTRDGKINFQSAGFFLNVESKPYDMLLAEIPWNINLIGFNWMENPLTVNWVP